MDFDEAVCFLARKLPEPPSVFISYTNALGKFPIVLELPVRLPCDQIPRFPPAKEGQLPLHLLYGRSCGAHVLVLQGRYHGFEGYDREEVAFPVKMARCLGCERMLAVNAAGSVDERFDLGDLMVVASHVDLEGLGGETGAIFREGERQIEKNAKVYDRSFARMARRVAVEEGMDKYVKTGVYGMIEDVVPKTYSQITNWKTLGIDAVGTSLVPEVSAASELGMEVSAVSVLTDKGLFSYHEYPDPMAEDISKSLDPKKPLVKKLILEFIKKESM